MEIKLNEKEIRQLLENPYRGYYTLVRKLRGGGNRKLVDELASYADDILWRRIQRGTLERYIKEGIRKDIREVSSEDLGNGVYRKEFNYGLHYIKITSDKPVKDVAVGWFYDSVYKELIL